jgi:hypothetical protein
MQRTLDLHYDKLIIGADLSALFFSIRNNIPIIFIDLKRPNRFDSNLNTYNNLLFKLASKDLIPFSNLVYSIRLEDNNLKVVTKNNLVATVSYTKLFVSDDSKIEGLPIITGKTNSENLIIDYIDIISGKNDEVKEINTENGNIIFYKSETNGIDAAHIMKINDKDINSFEFSEAAIRLKVLKEMKQNGFNGRFDKTNGHFKPIIIKSIKREIFPLGKNIYDTLPTNIEILYDNC